jgi:tetratricopeptide (TPR) repeat protein
LSFPAEELFSTHVYDHKLADLYTCMTISLPIYWDYIGCGRRSTSVSASGLRILDLAQEDEGNLVQARATLEQSYATAGSVATLIDLARVAGSSRDYMGALGYLAHARDLQPEDASIPYQFGVICVKLNLIGEARKAIGQAIKLDSENPNYNIGMGQFSPLRRTRRKRSPI